MDILEEIFRNGLFEDFKFRNIYKEQDDKPKLLITENNKYYHKFNNYRWKDTTNLKIESD